MATTPLSTSPPPAAHRHQPQQSVDLSAELSGCEMRTAAAKTGFLTTVTAVAQLAKAVFALFLIPFGQADWDQCKEGFMMTVEMGVLGCWATLAIAFPNWVFHSLPDLKTAIHDMHHFNFTEMTNFVLYLDPKPS